MAKVTVEIPDEMLQYVKKRLEEIKYYESLDEFVVESIRIRLPIH